MRVACPGRSRRLRPGFDALDILAELTQHIPPKGLQLIRRYGLYASRTKGLWEAMPWCRDRSSAAPEGWRATHQRGVAAENLGYAPLSDDGEEVNVDARKRAWVERFAKRYRKPEGPDCLRRYMRSIRSCAQVAWASRLIKIGRSPPGCNPDRLN